MPPKKKKKKTPEQLRQERLNRELIRKMEAEERVNNAPAKVVHNNTDRPNRVEAYYGGKGKPDGDGHGHVVSNDGLNAEYLREPGMAKGDYVVDDRQDNPYK